ncbi:MAG: isoprenylcysteine carboxylmethyltransferase family protein [Thermoleophilaceae bacterium]|nr:isoprenylcysteine carboxylmethyltransferase family protein [Thermoleophilaceae bacterium]
MAELAVGLLVVYFALAFGLRSLVQKRRTGSTGFRGISGAPGSAEWLGGVSFIAAIGMGLLAPILDLAGLLNAIDPLDGRAAHIAGIALFSAGLIATLVAQMAMGDAWRIGVAPDERTHLVTAGPFALVRNPIFSGMLPTSLGLALLVPNVVALAGLVALVSALEIQVRLVEEPHLRRIHGPDYEAYASQVGRFFPGVGQLRRH